MVLVWSNCLLCSAFLLQPNLWSIKLIGRKPIACSVGTFMCWSIGFAIQQGLSNLVFFTSPLLTSLLFSKLNLGVGVVLRTTMHLKTTPVN